VWPLRDLAHVDERSFGRELRWRGGCGDRVGGLVDAPNDQRAEDEQAGDGADGATRRGGVHARILHTSGAGATRALSSRAVRRGILRLPSEGSIATVRI